MTINDQKLVVGHFDSYEFDLATAITEKPNKPCVATGDRAHG
jgi:hypothetical protein